MKNCALTALGIVSLLTGCVSSRTTQNEDLLASVWVGPQVQYEIDQDILRAVKQNKLIPYESIAQCAELYGVSENEAREFLEARYQWYGHAQESLKSIKDGSASETDRVHFIGLTYRLMKEHLDVLPVSHRSLVMESYGGLISLTNRP